MMKKFILNLAYEQLKMLLPHKTLIILHPGCYYLHRQLAYRLLENSAGAYVHFTRRLNFNEFLAGIIQGLRTQAGIHLEISTTDPIQAAEQVAIAMLQDESPLLFIEGYDSISTQETDIFLVQMARRGCYIAIGSRILPLNLLDSREALLLPHSSEYLLVNYVDLQPHILEVRALGPGNAFINGRVLDTWDGVLPRNLFFYFIDKGMTTRIDIFSTFWGSLPKKDATNVFHVTKRKINEILKQNLTTYTGGYYRLSDGIHLHYDVALFMDAVQHAVYAEDENEAIQRYQQALEIYRAPFLTTIDHPWIQQRREELNTIYAESLNGLSKLMASRGQYTDSMGLCLRASAAMPLREDFVRDHMRVYDAMEHPEQALVIYEDLKQRLYNTLRVEPSPETRELAEEIRNRLSTFR